MHFHLPKPIHGWRGFIGEVGIIVIGVLIALGAEQVVESAHWREASHSAIEAMTKDGSDERWAIESRFNQQQCIDKRLADLETIFSRHEARESLGIVGAIGRPFYRNGWATSWTVAVADGSIAHLPLKERSRFAVAFGTYELYERQMWEEKRAWQQLQMLNHASGLTAADWSQARQAYDLASDFNASFRITLPQYIEKFRAFPKSNAATELTAFQIALCRPMIERAVADLTSE